MNDMPRILLFTGDGKGKTTAALGAVLRALGHGMRIHIIQFAKAAASGEHGTLERLGCELTLAGRGFIPSPDDPAFAEHRAAAEDGLRQAREAVGSRDADVVVLDEICVAVARGLLAETDVAEVVSAAPSGKTLILTGRGATSRLIELADTVTDMRCVKHALQTGRKAQQGVEL